MSPVRTILVLCLTALSLSASGCAMMGGGSRDGAAGKKGPGPREPKTAAREGGDDDFSGLSPEASMQRDLLQLREREARQLETVENMRAALDRGKGEVRHEEERLQDIRQQIERYDSAMRRYEMASRYAAPRDDRPRREAAPAPARDYSRDPDSRAGEEYAAVRHMRDPDRDYGRAVPDRGGNDYQAVRRDTRDAPEYARRPAISEGEVMIYDGRPDPRVPAQDPAAQARIPARPAQRFDDPGVDAFAAPTALSTQPRQAVQPARFEDGSGDGMLFAEAAARQKTPWPPAAPAAPAAPAPAKSVPPQLVQAPAAEEGWMGEEVFTPDLFLSRR